MKNQFYCTIFRNNERNFKIKTRINQIENSYRINLDSELDLLDAQLEVCVHLIENQKQRINVLESLYQNGLVKNFPKNIMEENLQKLNWEKSKILILEDIIQEIQIEISMRNTFHNLDKVVTISYNGTEEIMPEMEAHYLQSIGEDIIY